MAYTVAPQTFESLISSWTRLRHSLAWSSVFVLPQWLKVWWQVFGSEARLHLLIVEEDGNPIGIAPLLVREGRASFIGSADICDYLDFVIAPGKEKAFFTALLDNLEQEEDIRELHLESLRDDTAALTSLIHQAKERGYSVSCDTEDVSLYLDLPPTWEEYLEMLTRKQRGEVRRKLRRLAEAGDTEYRTVEGAESMLPVMDVFLKMLRESREEKAAFMTSRMESFFRSIADTMAEAGLLRFGILELDAAPVAVVLCFDYNDTVYLYNSGYDVQHSDLSVGILSKVLSVKDSIERGRKRYDFLKGAEEYKYRLGGKEIPTHSCRIVLK